jgi:hypothetical protein
LGAALASRRSRPRSVAGRIADISKAPEEVVPLEPNGLPPCLQNAKPKTKTSMPKLVSQKNDKTSRCLFFLDFLCFIAFSGVSQRWEFKKTTKSVLQKNLPIFFAKKSTKI